MTPAFAHESVMVSEVLAALSPRSGGIYADATAGGGGHSQAILDASAPLGRVVAVDRDPAAVWQTRQRLLEYGDRVLVVHGDYAELGPILRAHAQGHVDGLVADLGVSSPQIDLPERGFSFSHDGPLDMRMDPTQGETLAELLGRIREPELADILFQYGEERRSRPIARSILRARDEGKLTTTSELRRAVLRASGPRRGRGIDPATRTFQALRIAVNRELDQLVNLLVALPNWLSHDGVAVVISFHSLEDRLVKHAFRDNPRLTPLTKRPLTPTEEEQARNPRSRSAKLRAARLVPEGAEVSA